MTDCAGVKESYRAKRAMPTSENPDMGHPDCAGVREKQIPSLRCGMTTIKGCWMTTITGLRNDNLNALLYYGGGLAFLYVVLVPGGDFGDVGSWLFDDALTTQAAVELQAGG